MLAPGESVEVVLTFVAEEEGVFIDVIRIRSSLVEKAVPIIISVSSRGADFSLLFNLDEDSYVVGPEWQIESSLVAEGLHGGSMELRYVMMDAEGKILHEEIAEVDVVDKMSILKSMRVPSFFVEGSYVVGVIAAYGGEVQVVSRVFTVKEGLAGPSREEPKVLEGERGVWVFIVIALGIALHVFMSRRIKK